MSATSDQLKKIIADLKKPGCPVESTRAAASVLEKIYQEAYGKE